MQFSQVYSDIDNNIYTAVVFDAENCRRFTAGSISLSSYAYIQVNSEAKCTVLCDPGYWYNTYIIIYKNQNNVSLIAYYYLYKYLYYPSKLMEDAAKIVDYDCDISANIVEYVNKLNLSNIDKFLFMALAWKITNMSL